MGLREDLHNYLGPPAKSSGGHDYWQCPYCLDSGKDNLIYTHKKDIVKCMSCDDGAAKILKEINKQKRERGGKVDAKKEEKSKVEFNLDWGIDYWNACMESLKSDARSLAFLEKKRGIKKDTALNLGIGIDKEKRRWVLPVIDMEHQLRGFEYRPPDFGVFDYPPDKPPKCRKEPGTPSILSRIEPFGDKQEILVIIEGFLDGYVYWQMLQEKSFKGYDVVTPSNGVASTLDVISQDLAFVQSYKQVYVFLDNDEAGKEHQQKILKAYPEFMPMTLKCGCKDYNAHYLSCKEKKS